MSSSSTKDMKAGSTKDMSSSSGSTSK
jgi:hypothetical protein